MHSASTHTSRATVGIFNITFKISINFQNIWIDHLNSESDMHSASTSTFRATISILLEVSTLSHREVAHLNINIKAKTSWPLSKKVSSFLLAVQDSSIGDIVTH